MTCYRKCVFASICHCQFTVPEFNQSAQFGLEGISTVVPIAVLVHEFSEIKVKATRHLHRAIVEK